MSISTELTRLQKAKTDIKAAIEAKGVTVPSNDRIDEYSTYISQISSGASLNIAYGNTAPSDTSKLWIKGSEAEEVTITTQQQFTTLSTKLSIAASQIGTATVGTKIYLFGGSSTGSLDTIQVFDTTTNTISTLSTKLSHVSNNISAVTVGTKIYLFDDIIQVFDTTNITISTLSITSPTRGVYGIGAAAVGTKIYLFGGYNDGNYYRSINVFDTTNNNISTLSTRLSNQAYYLSAVTVGTKIYLFGGAKGNSSIDILDTIQVFDTTKNTISKLSTKLPTAARDIGAAAVGTKIYLLGGSSTDFVRLNTINVFDTTTNTINTLPTTLPNATDSIGVAAVDTKIYLFGGHSDSGRLDTINIFITQFSLTPNNILITEGQQENVFNLLSSPTQVEISVKNVYRGNSSNVAELNDAYLYNGSVWLNVNE